MLDADLLQHPVIRDRVDALVNARGGLVVYEQGLGGREALVAAAVGIAAATGRTLTVVDAELLREATARLTKQLGMAEHTFLSPEQAVNWPTGFTLDAVLAVHGDVLRNPELLEPLRNAALTARLHGYLVVARHPYGSDSLDPYTPLVLENRVTDFMPMTAGADRNSLDTPGPVDRRAQSPDFQAQNAHEPTWIPRKSDQQAQALVQKWVEQLESLNDTEPAGLSDEARERGRSYRTVWNQLRRARPDAPDTVQQDSNGVYWVTQDQSAGPAGTFADLEVKRQLLADLEAERTASAPDLHPRTPPQQSEAHQDPHDSPLHAPQRGPHPASEGRAAADGEAETQHTQRTAKPNDQVEPPSSADDEPTTAYQEFRALVEDPDALQAVQQRIAKVQADTSRRLQQAAAALDTPLPDHPASPRAARPSGNDAAQRTTREAHTPAAPPAPGLHP